MYSFQTCFLFYLICGTRVLPSVRVPISGITLMAVRIPWYGNLLLVSFNQSPSDRHLSCFQFFTIINISRINIFIRIFCLLVQFFPLR